MRRTILAVLGGYAAMVIAVMAISGLTLLAIPHDPDLLMRLNLVTAVPCAMLGGWTTARIARGDEIRHTLYLAGFGLFMGAINVLMMWNHQPHWYLLAVVALMVPAIIAGGFLRARRAAKLIG